MSRRSASGSSITAHRLFAPGLALWFGALFGLSSLAIGTGLFEQLVVASRLDQVVPAAAPPLGHAARLLLALAFGLIGALIGWAVAKAIAAMPGGQMAGLDPHYEPTPFDPTRPDAYVREPAAQPEATHPEREPYQVRARDAHPDAPARRPISAREELRDAELGRPLEPLGLSADAVIPPAPEELPQAARFAGPAAATAEEVAPPPPPPPPVTPTPAPAVATALPRFVVEGGEDDELPRLGPASEQPAAAPPPPAPTVEPVRATPPSASARILEAEPASLSHVELIERLAIAMRRREAAQEQAAAAAAPATPANADPAAALADAGAAMREALAGLKDSGGN